VDDEEAVSALLEVVLHQAGFRVWRATAAATAVELFAARRDDIALALLDVRMPGTDGPATLRALRAIDPALTCCFMTGDSGRYTPQYLLGLDAAAVFDKPFDMGKLPQAVRQLVFGPPAVPPAPAAGAERRRFPRWRGTPVTILVAPAADPDGDTAAAVTDRSLGGAALVAPAPWPPGTAVRVRAATPANAPWLPAEVRHVRADGGGWVVGCRWARPPHPVLAALYG
jgi:DNA-binding NarL/FixJ family response regulator